MPRISVLCRAALPAAFAVAPLITPALADVEPLGSMMRYPDVGPDRICFVYANDLWTVPKAGGVASPLASPPGAESFPRFSPDGKTIAFVGNYDGNRDLYTVPVEGGVPFRVTHHPGAETMADWIDAGRLLYFTNAFAGLTRQQQLVEVAASGGLPRKLPVPYGAFGSISPDGTWLAYTPHSTDNRTWKRYRGGMATDVWLFNLKDGSSRRVTDWEGTDSLPMFVPGGDARAVYYISDAGPEHRLNIWAYDIASGTRTQVTAHKADDVRWPSIGPGANGQGEIVFQLGAELRLLNLATKADAPVKVAIPGDRPTIRPRTVDASKTLRAAAISPSGKRVVAEARGDLWTAPAKEGVVRNLTRTDGVFERDPAWSPDGKWIAYFSDESGEYELWARPSDARPAKDEKKDDAKGKEEEGAEDGGEAGAPAAADQPGEQPAPPAAPRRLTALGAGFRSNPTWSPDSKSIAFTDEAGRLHLCTVETGESKVVDTDPWGQLGSMSWSSDSRWLAYARSDEGNNLACLWLYSAATGERTRVTAPFFNSTQPVFDRKGEFLYFQSNREISSPVYADLDTTFAYAGTDRLYAIPLRTGVKNPFAVKSDEEELKADDEKQDGDRKDDEKKEGEKKDDDKKDADKDDGGPGQENEGDKPAGEAAQPAQPDPAAPKEAKDKKDKSDQPKEVRIDLEGMERRAIQLPLDAGAFGPMAVTKDGKLVYVRRQPRGIPGEPSIRLFDPGAEKKEEKTVTTGSGGFRISAAGEHLLVRKGGGLHVMKPEPDAKGTEVPTAGMTATINPRREWRQLFTDVFRLQRDFFYEPTLHGVDWPALRDHYAAMIEECVSREDVAYVVGEFISELNVGHAYLGGPGDVEQAPSVPGGLLGCDFELVNGAYRIAAIHEGGPWDADARGPLSQPGVDAKVGDYLLAVNGTPVDAAKDPWAALIGTAGRPTALTVGPNPTIDAQSREIVVKPLESEAGLRFRGWIEKNRASVDQRTGGRVGYIYVPNTGVDGQNELFRQFYGQRDRAALIIDERWNGGGQIPTRFIELLNRPPTNYWAVRHGHDTPWPPDAHFGPKCMLINGLAGSGGDMFPWLFRHNGLGTLIGTRTWGGLVGISGNPELIDGGSITVPTFGFYETDGTWGVEGHGVDPDIEVIDDPAKMAGGADVQLDAAIDHMLAELEKNPYSPPKRPASPKRAGMGLDPADK